MKLIELILLIISPMPPARVISPVMVK